MQWVSHDLRHCLAASLSFPDKPTAAEICHGGTHTRPSSHTVLYWIFLEQDILALLVFTKCVECVVSIRLLRLCTQQHTCWLMQSLHKWHSILTIFFFVLYPPPTLVPLWYMMRSMLLKLSMGLLKCGCILEVHLYVEVSFQTEFGDRNSEDGLNSAVAVRKGTNVR